MNDKRIGRPVQELPTPCLVVDLDRMEANIRRMQQEANARGVKLRPHIKTHKVPAIAQIQLAAGASGITVAKVSEAEVFAAAGIRDMFIAYPVIGADKAERVATLVKAGSRVIVGVESEFGARQLAEAARSAGVTIEVRIEVDSGLHRCGVPPTQVLELARQIVGMQGLSLEGIFTYRSTGFAGAKGRSKEDVGREEGELMGGLAAELRAAGIPVASVSAGSTPTGLHSATGGVTEIRPGTYVFSDNMQVGNGVSTPDHLALTVLATVVSRPGADLATVDAGSKTFCGDVNPAGIGAKGYGLGYEVDGYVERMNEEHGVVRLGEGVSPQIGDKLRFTPNHVCTSVNLSDELIGVRNGRTEVVWAVAARGKRE